jgi:hypothetical protein
MLIPPMAFVAGIGLAHVEKKSVVAIILFVVAVEGLASQFHILQVRQPYLSLVDLEQILDEVSERNDLIVINGTANDDPTPMYFAHRKGWVFTNENIVNSNNLDRVTSNGCKYAVIVKSIYGDVALSYPVVHDSTHFRIYKIQ